MITLPVIHVYINSFAIILGYVSKFAFFQFHSPKGVPFHVNLPSTIISTCLRTPSIATRLQRYPVVSKDVVR